MVQLWLASGSLWWSVGDEEWSIFGWASRTGFAACGHMDKQIVLTIAFSN